MWRVERIRKQWTSRDTGSCFLQMSLFYVFSGSMNGWASAESCAAVTVGREDDWGYFITQMTPKILRIMICQIYFWQTKFLLR